MLEFRISIGNTVILEPINEPIGFDAIDFNLRRDKDYFSVSNQFAGNKHVFKFDKGSHYNIIDSLFKEYETKGFNAFATITINQDSDLLFVGTLDFASCVTDMVNYLECQVIVKDKLSVLEDNKSVKIDLLSDKDLMGNNAPILPLTEVFIDSLNIDLSSKWYHDGIKSYNVQGSFNTIRINEKYGINNSLSWLYAVNSSSSPIERYRSFKVVDAKENLQDIIIRMEFGAQTKFVYANEQQRQFKLRLIVFHGLDYEGLGNDDWINGVTEFVVWEGGGDGSNEISLPSVLSPRLDAIPRNHGIWILFDTPMGVFTDDNSSIEITATTQDFSSIVNASTYKQAISNTIKKASGINNVEFIGLDYYNLNYVFNGNLLRNITDKPFYITWNNIKEQLTERCVGLEYNQETDTLTLAHRDYFYPDKEIIAIGDYQKQEFYEDKPDADFIINTFGYEYKKYQAQKENSVIGNSGSVHGESEWYVKNKNVSGDLKVSLPFVRDSFMIEDTRRKAIEYNENTATNEDDTITILDCQSTNGQINLSEFLFLQASFSEGIQTLKNDLSFSWLNIGIKFNSQVLVDGWGYVVSSADHNVITLNPNLVNTPQLNETKVYEFTYSVNLNYKSKIDNGLFNQAFSIRQNIQHWRSYLGSCNYYTGSSIDNTFYKENKESSFNGLKEDARIFTIGERHEPRLISGRLRITTDEFNIIKSNTRGFIRILDSRNNPIRVYVDELDGTFLDGCDLMEVNITGKLNIEPLNLVVTKDKINNDVFPNMTYKFYDDLELVSFYDENEIPIYVNRTPIDVCTDSYCFNSYESMKSYLLSL